MPNILIKLENAIKFSIVFMSAKIIVYVKERVNKIENGYLREKKVTENSKMYFFVLYMLA